MSLKKYINYLKDNPEGYWFKRKVFGWGWMPVRWQGWLTVLVYIALLIFIFNNTDQYQNASTYVLFINVIVPFITTTMLLTVIGYLKGEPPRWQWGLPDKEPSEEK